MKHLFFTAFFVCFLIQTFAQAYKPFPTQNAVWNYNYRTHGICNTCCQDYSYSIEKDTLIHGMIYQKIIKQGVYYLNTIYTGSCTDTVTSTFQENAGYIRNDSVNKKVFFNDASMANDTLLYDFNISLGDTLASTYSFNNQGPNYYICDTIYSANINGIPRKVFGFTDWYPFVAYPRLVLIEGIGFVDGLFSNTHNSLAVTVKLQCFKENNVVAYPDTVNSCDLITQLSEQNYGQGKISLFPNPILDKLELEFNNDSKIQNIQVLNLLGREQNITWKKSSNTQYQLNTSYLSKGIYLIQLITNQGVISKKVVKH